MLSGYIIPAGDLFSYASACSIFSGRLDTSDTELIARINEWLRIQDGLPLLRRIQPQNMILLPTRAITGARFLFKEDDRDATVKRVFLDCCPNPILKEGMGKRMKFVTVPNPYSQPAPVLPENPLSPSTRARKRNWSEI